MDPLWIPYESLVNFMNFSEFGGHLGGQNPSKIVKKSKKSDVKTCIVFCIDFFMVWAWFSNDFEEKFGVESA